MNGHTISNLSGTAIAIGIGAFAIFTEHIFWGLFFIALAIFLALITGRQ